MKRKTKIGIVVVGLLIVSLSVGTAWFIQWDRNRRFEFWLENHFPTTNKFMMQDSCFYPSYEAWAQAGQEIPGVEDRLIAKYAQVDGGFDQWLLIYAMGAVHSPESLDFLRDILFSTDDEELQVDVLNALYFSVEAEGVQVIFLEYVRDPRFPAPIRCTLLALVASQGNQDALAYIESHGKDLVLQAWEEGSHIRGVTELNEAWSLGLPPSPTIWELIEEEVAELRIAKAALPDESSPEWAQANAALQAQRAKAVARVGRCYRWVGLVPLIEEYREVQGRVLREEGSEAWVAVESFALDVVLEDSDSPDIPDALPQPTFIGVVIATISADGGGDADALIKLIAQGDIYGGWLRSFWWEDIRAEVEDALRKLESSPNESPAKAQAIACFRSTLASYDYMDQLDDDARDAYSDFEWQLWRAWALAPRDDQDTQAGYQYVADELVADWEEGYEPFVLRIFEEPTSLAVELNIAVRLVGELSPEGQRRLAEIAESDSPHAEYARRAVASMITVESP